MIMKYRDKPAKIAGYEAMLKRLAPNHPKRTMISDALYNHVAGIGGEERVDDALSYFEPDYPFLIIQDLQLPNRAQIDTLIITEDCVIILEIKNLGGQLRLRSNPSALDQTALNGQRRFFRSPVIQAETAKIKMESILKSFNCPLPVETAVVMAYSSQFIENVPPGATVWSADEVLIQLNRRNIHTRLLTPAQMEQLAQSLLSFDLEYQLFPLSTKYGIPLSDIEKGVFCPRCQLRKMERTGRRWECKFCNLYSKDAHLEAVDHWFMLCKSTINTNECKNFLGLTDLDAAKRVLKRKGLIEVGGRRNRTYHQ
ncbi:hypothetical protein HNQ44_000830 [Planomicrobium koreense]|uniref:NERD domain-containing protein n=1 Tax=Planococcus koreensis TaxID=112331 RepID=A0A7W8CPW0_9BACL|nr:nuclease-related domain-containing protein [Planococcus koreensis]MBB5179406.1 hypothetical protein [Planococcus koreensis]